MFGGDNNDRYWSYQYRSEFHRSHKNYRRHHKSTPEIGVRFKFNKTTLVENSMPFFAFEMTRMLSSQQTPSHTNLSYKILCVIFHDTTTPMNAYKRVHTHWLMRSIIRLFAQLVRTLYRSNRFTWLQLHLWTFDNTRLISFFVIPVHWWYVFV